jgi:hypothetical protein
MYDTWQSLDNWLRYGLQNTSFSQVFGYNNFDKTSSKGKLGAYSKYEKHRNSNVSAVLLDNSASSIFEPT